jgi:hypothetical protein
MVRPYKLKPYTNKDFENSEVFDQKNFCAVCGHHLPLDQEQKVGKDWVHTDVRICLALILKSGHKAHNVKGNKELFTKDVRPKVAQVSERVYDAEDDLSPCCGVHFTRKGDNAIGNCSRCGNPYNVI